MADNIFTKIINSLNNKSNLKNESVNDSTYQSSAKTSLGTPDNKVAKTVQNTVGTAKPNKEANTNNNVYVDDGVNKQYQAQYEKQANDNAQKKTSDTIKKAETSVIKKADNVLGDVVETNQLTQSQKELGQKWRDQWNKEDVESLRNVDNQRKSQADEFLKNRGNIFHKDGTVATNEESKIVSETYAQMNNINEQVKSLNDSYENGQIDSDTYTSNYKDLVEKFDALQSSVGDYEIKTGWDYYDAIKDSGTQEAYNLTEYLSHFDDNVLERLTNQLGANIVEYANAPIQAMSLAYNSLTGEIDSNFNQLAKENVELAQQYREYTYGGANGFEKVTNEIIGSMMPQLIATGVAIATGGSSTALMGFKGGIDDAYQMMNEGYTTKEALVHGTMVGTISYLVEKIGADDFTKLLTGASGQWVIANSLWTHVVDYKQLLKTGVNSMLAESVEEFVEGYATAIGNDIYNSIYSTNFDGVSEIDLAQLGKESLYAGISALLMTGAQVGSQSINLRISNQKGLDSAKQCIAQLDENIKYCQTQEELNTYTDLRDKIASTINDYNSRSELSNSVREIKNSLPSVDSYNDVMNTLAEAYRYDISKATKMQMAMDDAKKTVNSALLNRGIQTSTRTNSDTDVASMYLNGDEKVRKNILEVGEVNSKLGTDIRIGDSKNDAEFISKTLDGKTKKAYYDPKTNEAVVNVDEADGVIPAIMHELTHSLEKSKGYKKIVDVINKNGGNVKTSEDVAYYIENNIANEDFIREIVANDSSLISKFARFIKAIPGKENRTRIENAWMNAFRDYDISLSRNGDIQYAFEKEEDFDDKAKKFSYKKALEYTMSVANIYNESETNNIDNLLKDNPNDKNYNQQKVIDFALTDMIAKEEQQRWKKSQKEMLDKIKEITGLKVLSIRNIPFEHYKFKKDGMVIIDPGSKSRKSAVKKVMKTHYIEHNMDYALEDMKDHNRLSIQVVKPSDILGVIEKVRTAFPMASLEVKNGAEVYVFDKNGNLKVKDKSGANNLGYIGFHIIWKDGGINHEVQITPDFDLKMEGENVYNKWRNVDLGSIYEKIGNNAATDDEVELFKQYSQERNVSINAWKSLGDGEMPSVISAIVSSETGRKYEGDLKKGLVGFNQLIDDSSKNPIMNPLPSSINDNLSNSSSNTIDNPLGNNINNTSLSNNIISNNGSEFSSNEPSVEDLYLEKGEQRNGTPQNRDINFKAQTEYGKTRLFARTMGESTSATTNELANKLVNDYENISYETYTNKRLLKNAWDNLTRQVNNSVIDDAVKLEQDIAEKWLQDSRLNSQHFVEGQILVSEIAKTGNTDLALKIAEKLAEDYTEAGRAVQSARVYKTLTPEGKLRALEKNIENANKRLKARGFSDIIDIDKETKKEYLKALVDNDTQKAEKIEQNIQKHIIDSMPSTLLDKINSWRYISMLGNPKTMVRNIIGNAISSGMAGVKDAIKVGFESAYASKNSDYVRTTSFLGLKDKPLMDFARKTFPSFEKSQVRQGKYKNEGDLKQSHFSSKTLQSVESVVNWAMNNEVFGDTAFVRERYVYSLAQYMKANGMDANVDQNSKEFKAAQEYAWKEAERAAFHEVNELAKAINKFGATNKFTSFIKESLIPFTTTPLNVARQGINYSPLGLIYHSINDMQYVKNGMDSNGNSYTMENYLDYLAQGTTGTGIFLIGAFLAKMGILRTKDDDKDRLQNYQSDIYGEQDYSITLGDKGSYTIDWATPLILPLALGAEIFNALGGDMEISDFADLAGTVLNPLSETTMLSSLQSALKSYGNNDSGSYLSSVLSTMFSNYINQMIPTLFGQIKRTFDGTRYTTSGSRNGTEKLIKQIDNKIGIIPDNISKIQPYINSKGETVNSNPTDNTFFNFLYQTMSPGYIQKNKATENDDEITRLYEAAGDTGVLPSSKTTSFTYEGESYKLTNDNYTAYNQAKLSSANYLVNEFLDSKEYDTYDDDTRTYIIGKLRDYSNSVAKNTVLGSKGIEFDNSEYNKVQSAIDNGMSVVQYYENAYVRNNIESLKDENGKTIANSKAMQVRKAYEDNGTYEAILKSIESGETSADDWGLSKTVIGYSSDKFKSYYNSLINGQKENSSKVDKTKTTSKTNKTKTEKTTKVSTTNSTKTTKSKETKQVVKETNTLGGYLKAYATSMGYSQNSATVCPKCGTTVTSSATRCPVCGTNL